MLLRPWDYAAGQLIVEEAGGKVSDFSGNLLFPDRPSEVLASNGQIHEELIRLLNEA